MKRAIFVLSAFCISTALVVSSGGLAQEKSPAKKTETRDAEAKSKNRLPDNYGKIGLTEAQRARIYGIQLRYRGEIEALQKQIADKRAAEENEIEAVLSAEQKAIVVKLKEEADAKKKEAKQKAKDKKQAAAGDK